MLTNLSRMWDAIETENSVITSFGKADRKMKTQAAENSVASPAHRRYQMLLNKAKVYNLPVTSVETSWTVNANRDNAIAMTPIASIHSAVGVPSQSACFTARSLG